jgi:hypothetical protein
MKKIAYSYQRISSWKQVKEATKDKTKDSLDTQFENAATWCKNNDITLDTNLKLVDKAVSAFVGENTDTGMLGQFVELLKEGIIGNNCYLLLDTWTRCSRDDVSKQLEIFLSITNNGATIVTLDDKQEYSEERNKKEPYCWYIVIGKMIAANDFSRQISRSSKNTWVRRRKETNKEGKIFTKRCPEWLEVKDKEYHPIEKKVKTINKIFDLCIEGLGNQRIANYLNEHKIATISGRGIWQCSQIARLLKNKKVIGVHEFTSCRKVDKGKRLPIKVDGTTGYSSTEIYPKIISYEKWSKVRQLKEKRPTFNIQRESSKYVSVFANILYCGYHRCTMKFINKGEYKHKNGKLTQKNGYYISTDAANNNKPYVRHGWHVDMLEDAFFSFIPYLQINLKDKTKQNQDTKILNERLAKLEYDIEEKAKTIDNYRKDLDNNASTDNQRRYAYEGIEKGETFITEARNEINTISASKEEINKTEETRGTISEWLKEWKERRNEEDFRRSINAKLKLVIDKILVFGGGFKFNELALNRYLKKLEKMIHENGGGKELPPLNSKYFLNLSEKTYANNHFVLDLIIKEIIRKHLPNELRKEAWSLYSATRIPDKDKSKRFFVIFPKNSDGVWFQVKPEETFNIGHENKFLGLRWWTLGHSLIHFGKHRQQYSYEGYNPIIHHLARIKGQKSKWGCLDNKESYWFDVLPPNFKIVNADWKDIV